MAITRTTFSVAAHAAWPATSGLFPLGRRVAMFWKVSTRLNFELVSKCAVPMPCPLLLDWLLSLCSVRAKEIACAYDGGTRLWSITRTTDLGGCAGGLL